MPLFQTLFAHFALIAFRRAMDIYDELLKRGETDPNIYVYKACCLYALCSYKEAKAECEKAAEDSPLKMRLLF